MIGDCWEADIVGAYQSDIDQIWLNPKGLPAEGFTPTYTVKSLAEIKEILLSDLAGEVELDVGEILLRHHQHIAGIR